MSERLNRMPESGAESYEHHQGEHERRAQKHHEVTSEKARHEHREKLEHIQKTIEKEAKKSDEIKIDQKPETDAKPNAPSFISSDLSTQALKQNLRMVQRGLSKPERQFSKIIHNPGVDLVSETAGKTIARPPSLLFGGIFAFITNLAVLIICRHFGYEYNYLIGIAGFGGGFLLGLLIEALYRLVLRRQT